MTGEPGVVSAPGIPGEVGETGHRVPGPSTGYRVLPGPGVTGTCSEYTGRFTSESPGLPVPDVTVNVQSTLVG